MKRNLFGAWFLVLAVFAFGSTSDAAQKHSTHRRTRHTSRVTTGAPAKKKPAASTKRHVKRTVAPKRATPATKPK